MTVLTKEHIVAFDVDQTLIMHDDKGKLKIKCGGLEYRVRVHKKHLQLLRQYKHRGYAILVWSAAGHLWAEEVVHTLGLEKIVDFVMSKPEKHVDDLPTHKILGSRIYLPE